MEIGQFTRTSYDKQAYDFKMARMINESLYHTNKNYVYNEDQCFQPLTNIGYIGNGDSTATNDNITPALSLVPLDSVLKNLNVKISKDREGNVNPIDVSKIKLNNKPVCTRKLTSQHSRLTNPAGEYRELETNRFYDLLNDPQENIFVPFAVNSRLTATDNYIPQIPKLWEDKNCVTPLNYSGCVRKQKQQKK